MPKREDELLVKDIIGSLNDVLDFTKGVDYETFVLNKMMVNASVRCFEIMGEASKLLSEEFKSNNPQVEWRKLTNFRNVLIHNYFGIDYEIVWQFIDEEAQEHLDFLETIEF